MRDDTPEARAAARRNRQVQVFRLGEDLPGDDLVVGAHARRDLALERRRGGGADQLLAEVILAVQRDGRIVVDAVVAHAVAVELLEMLRDGDAEHAPARPDAGEIGPHAERRRLP